MNDRLIGPGENDYGRQPPPAASLGFNPCEGDPKTTAQMEAVIALRNAEAMNAEIRSMQSAMTNPVTCACGYQTIEFGIVEVASLHLCPNCRKVHLSDPEGLHEDILGRLGTLTKERDEADRRAGAAERLLAWEKDGTVKREQWLDKAKRDAGYDRSISFDVVWAAALKALLGTDKTEQKLFAARDGLKAADVALSRDFAPDSYARRKVADALKASE